MSYLSLTDLDKPYVYPMSNATNGGEAHTEYNLRSALANLLSYSAAFSSEDFFVKLCEYYDTANDQHLLLAIDSGFGNCNGYYVHNSNYGTQDNPKRIPFNVAGHLSTAVTGAQVRFGLYLCLDYASTLADGLSFKFITDGIKLPNALEFSQENTEYSEIFNAIYKSQRFNDIGIKLGDMIYEVGSGFSAFTQNPDKTKCIDISRLGSDLSLSITLGNLINRLRTLNIFGGDLYLSDTLFNGSDITSTGAAQEYGGDFRLKLHTQINQGIAASHYKMLGSISLVKTELGGADSSECTIFSFTTNDLPKPTDAGYDASNPTPITISALVFNGNIVFDSITATNVTSNNIQAQAIAVGDYNTSGAHTSGTIINNNGFAIGDITNGFCTVAKQTFNGTPGIASDGPISASKVYGAVWM